MKIIVMVQYLRRVSTDFWVYSVCEIAMVDYISSIQNNGQNLNWIIDVYYNVIVRTMRVLKLNVHGC